MKHTATGPHLSAVHRILIAFTVLGACGGPSAEATPEHKLFLLRDASTSLDVAVEYEFDADVDSEAYCGAHFCGGPATIRLFRKSEATPFQTLNMPFLLELDGGGNPKVNNVKPYRSKYHGVIFDDFNFDGHEDLALCNGHNGAFGSPSYDILLFSNAEQRFDMHAELTDLAHSSLGLFAVDEDRKQLTTFTKDGCCRHQTTRYELRDGHPLKVHVLTEDGESDKVVMTTEELVDGTWRKTEKTMSLAEWQGSPTDETKQAPAAEAVPVHR